MVAAHSGSDPAVKSDATAARPAIGVPTVRWPINQHHQNNDPAGLHAALHFGADRAVIALSGTIDCVSGPMLANLLDAVEDGSVPEVEVDMAQVDFIDIAGLRVLSRAHQLGVERGVLLAVRRPPPHLVWLLRFTGTTRLLAGGRTPDGDETTFVDPIDVQARQADERDLRADERDRLADERDELAEDLRSLDAERSRLLDERQQSVLEHQRWEDIREEVANERERDLERRERDC
jgi:anti-anti-sigma factor